MSLDALAFGAHPDDVELTCGGTLCKLSSIGYSTGVVSLSRGELGTRGNRSLREQEFEAAATLLNTASHLLLDLPDGNISNSEEQRVAVIEVIRRFKPGIVFAPYWEDRHPDHARASELVRDASFLAGLTRIETGQEAHRPYKVIYYASRYEFTPSFIVDVSPFHEQKLSAIRAYGSQFHNPSAKGEAMDETNISRPEFLEAIVTRARQYGSYIGVEYGEPFLVREPMRLADPVAFFGSDYLSSFL